MAKRGGSTNPGNDAAHALGNGGHAIPDKLYFRIGEVAALCNVPTYVLRFWQSEFPQLHPGKSGTGQRLYRRRDVEMALRIKRLLHEEGYTIAGARAVIAGEDALPRFQPELPLAPAIDARLGYIRGELRAVLDLLGGAASRADPHDK